MSPRLTEHAHVGQLLTTAAIVELVVEREDVTVTALGAIHLKNVGEPVDVHAIEVSTRRPTAQVLDPVCRMFVDADDAGPIAVA